MRSGASSFNWQYPLLSLKSSSSFLRLLPHLLVTSICPFMCVCVRARARVRIYIYIYIFSGTEEKMKGYSHATVLWSVSLISSPSTAAVAAALSHTKPASARCPYFFCSSTYLQAGLAPGENIFNTALIFKYWPFIFEYCLSVLAKKVECSKFSLPLIP